MSPASGVDPMPAANIRRHSTHFLYLQNPDDLLIAEPAAFHSSVPLRNRLYRKNGNISGGTSLSRHNDLAQAMDYMLKRWGAFTRFLSDGRICLTNNAAERMLRGAALGRKAWLFAGSDQGGERAAAMYSLIQTAKLNDIDPRAWLADVLARIADMPQQRLHELLPWNWKKQQNMAPGMA